MIIVRFLLAIKKIIRSISVTLNSETNIFSIVTILVNT